ncbi:MAG: ATP-binding cassette domain-containing protein [Muribaculaceae bacterium]|nr:ATP-binding cassette domain-containing protein [Muribaculaceae bacterium]
MSSSLSNKSNIEKIVLNRVIPDAFASAYPDSEIWNRDFTFEHGKFYRIDASSGGGKSSLCSFIYGLRHDYSGSILIGNKNIKSLDGEQLSAIRTLNIAYLPQDLALFLELTAEQNIQIKNSLTNHKTQQQIAEMAQLLGVDSFMHRKVSTLSIGQQQRVAIIRSLCQPFDFILLDEPVSHLDSDNNRAVSQLVINESTANGAAIISTSVGNNLMIDNHIIVKL